MNSVNIIGNLTKDPELRYTTGKEQKAVCNMNVAVNVGYGDNQRTSFIPVTAFGKIAENCEKFLAKGSKVGISGSLTTGSYDNKEGKKVYTWAVIANSIEFLTSKKAGVNNQSDEVYNQPEGQQTGFTQLQDDDIPF